MDSEINGKRLGGEKDIVYNGANDENETAYVEDIVGLHRRLSNREHCV
jgi:hypothetical protein